jgi:DNA polymerase-1
MKLTMRAICTTKDVLIFKQDIDKYNPKYVAFDTETDGLYINYSKPFLYTFGFITNDLQEIYTYDLDLEQCSPTIIQKTFDTLFYMIKQAVKCLLQHASFDLHMSDNCGHPIPEELYPKLTDVMFYMRLANNATPPDRGGINLDLKGYVTRFIDPKAKSFENKLKLEIKNNRRACTAHLMENLKEQPLPTTFKITGKEKRWTKEIIDIYLKDKTHEIDELPEPLKTIFKIYEEEFENASNYRLLNRKNVTLYAHYDIVFTIYVWLHTKDTIIARQNTETLKREEDALIPIYEMEKAGKYFNLEYALASKTAVRAYILELREEMQRLGNTTFKVGQSAKIKDIFLDQWQLILDSSDKITLQKVRTSEKPTEDAKQFAKIITELKHIEKWYSTYLIRWIKEAQLDPNHMIYPTYKQVGTVTGRVSSPFQQFPRNAMYKLDGTLVFHPRKMFPCPKGYKLVYFDFSQMELRIQAIYTILLHHGDVNLCRAFIPYECVERNGKWYFKEEPTQEWIPTDLHALTAKNAFKITEDNPNFKAARAIAKSANFAMIYGATPARLKEALQITLQEAQNLYNAFYKNYPKILNYVQYVTDCVQNQKYLQNLFGRRYYGMNAHEGRNYLIQGFGADYTKTLLPLLRTLIKNTNIKLEGYLHDEFSFRIPEDHLHIIPTIKECVEQLESPIKMIAGVEIADTDWSDKNDYELSEEGD